MVFRLPTHLQALVPPPSEQVSLPGPWRGTFVVSSADGTAKGIGQEVRVTAVEIGGDSQTDLWSSQLVIYMTRERSSLNDFRAWVRRHAPPICTFMPDRVHEPNADAANQKNFASLSRILLLNQMVAIAPWNPSDRLPGAGIVLFPTQHSNNLLFGAVFLSSSFPDFISISPTGSLAPLPAMIPSRQPVYAPSYPQHLGYASPYATTSYQHIPQAGPSYQPPSSPGTSSYRYGGPRLAPAGSFHSSATAGPSSWSTGTDPDDVGS